MEEVCVSQVARKRSYFLRVWALWIGLESWDIVYMVERLDYDIVGESCCRILGK